MGCSVREIYRQLKKQSFKLYIDDMGQEYCELQQSAVKENNQGVTHVEQQYGLNTRVYDTQVRSVRLATDGAHRPCRDSTFPNSIPTVSGRFNRAAHDLDRMTRPCTRRGPSG